MKRNGFIELQLILMLVGVGTVAGLLWGAYKLGGDNRAKTYELVAQQEKTARVEMISGLALELARRSQQLHEERLARDRDMRAAREERQGRLHEFVASGDDSCIRTGWVRYTNAAAAGVPLGVRPGPGVAQAPSGVGTDTVAAVVANNYDKYHDCEAKVAGILADFDAKRKAVNAVIEQINKRVRERR